MNGQELPMLIKRCLAFGISPHQLNNVLDMYEKYKIPDSILAKMSETEVNLYRRGLDLAAEEFAIDWCRGHEILVSLGFVRKEKQDGHRCYVSLVYPAQQD